MSHNLRSTDQIDVQLTMLEPYALHSTSQLGYVSLSEPQIILHGKFNGTGISWYVYALAQFHFQACHELLSVCAGNDHCTCAL